MNNNVFQLRPCANISLALRNIADRIDSGEYVFEDMTIVAGTDVFHLGDVNDSEAVANAVYNLQLGLHKLMKASFD